MTIAGLHPPADPAGKRPLFSIVLPAFNEQAVLPQTYVRCTGIAPALSAMGLDYELIFVNDGSTDRTWEILNEQFGPRPDALLVRHEFNRGVAAAISTGLDRAREIACSMD